MAKETFSLDDCVLFLTSKISKHLSEVLEKRLSAYHITRVQWFAVYYAHTDHAITQRDLADKLGLKEPTVATLIDRCEKEGLLLRQKTQGDKRKKNLALTEKGQSLFQELNAVSEQFMLDAIEGISPEDLMTYKNVLDKMLANFQEDSKP